MSDKMTFPETWEEFEKSYGFDDSEEIYTNGSRLIPSFRVKQWLDHVAQDKTKQQATVSSECISRQDAVDATYAETVSTNPEHFKSSEKFIGFMDDIDISEFGRWQWANGFNTALVETKIQLEKLPSAESEPMCINLNEPIKVKLTDWGKTIGDGRPLADSEVIPRLQDIKRQIGGSYAIERAIEVLEELPSAEPEIIRCRDCKHHDGIRCFRWNSTIITGFDDFCSNAERRTDE